MVKVASFERFARRLQRVEDIGLRVGLACEELGSRDDLAAAELLNDCSRVAFAGEVPALGPWLALALALFEPGVEERRMDLAKEAARAGMHRVTDLLIPQQRSEGQGRELRVPNMGLGRPLTLGERKSLARTHERSLIQRVVQDPHPSVVAILLDNPRLTEDDVIRICAARPVDPRVLRVVFQHRRWVVRYRPRNAIVRNPACPLDIALLLAPLLRRPDLKDVSVSAELAVPLRLHCKSIGEMRSQAQEQDR